MIYLNVLGQHYVVLSSLEVISDLFEKRSSNYSDRKHVVMLNELYLSHSFHFFFSSKGTYYPVRYRMDLINKSMVRMPYGPWWRKHRKLFHQYFHRNTVTEYQPIQRQEIQAFLCRLLITPDNFLRHIRQ